jgi:hypothetical protein
MDPEYVNFRKVAKAAGYRSVQSTPLLTTDAQLLGVVSTLFANVHMPTKIEMEALVTYGIAAADHAYRLLDVPLPAKAEQMQEKLFADMLTRRNVRVSRQPPSKFQIVK